MNKPDVSSPLVIVSLGIAGGAVLWGVAQLLPAIADAVGILVKAVAAASGLAFAVATTGFATAGTVATWLPIAASAGVAATGISATYLVVARIVEKGRERPYEWLLPALGLLAVFFVDLTKDELVPTVLQRAIYALITGLFTVGGGFLLMQRRVVARIIGFGLPFAPSIVVWLLLLRAKHVSGALSDFIASGSLGAIGLVGVFVLGAVIAILGVLLPSHKQAAQ